MNIKEQTHFAKRLAFLVSAGVPVLNSLHLLRKQTKAKRQGRMFDQVISDVANGKYLSASLGQFKHIFGNFAINIIKVGEQSGSLSQNLNYLADELKKKHALRRKILGALVYPIFITVATLGVTGLLTAYIFPKLMPIFIGLNVVLPLTTRVLIGSSNFLRHDGLFSLVVLVLLVAAFFILLKKLPRFHHTVDRSLLTLPLVGPMIQSYNLTNFCRTLGLCLKSGVRVAEAARITADTTQNLVYRQTIKEIAEYVTRGEKISKRLEQSPKVFPDISTQMIAIGEQTGGLADTLIYLAEFHENEVEDFTKNLSSSIEPALMIFMGVLVGFIAMSVITPIYAITQNLPR